VGGPRVGRWKGGMRRRRRRPVRGARRAGRITRHRLQPNERPPDSVDSAVGAADAGRGGGQRLAGRRREALLGRREGLDSILRWKGVGCMSETASSTKSSHRGTPADHLAGTPADHSAELDAAARPRFGRADTPRAPTHTKRELFPGADLNPFCGENVPARSSTTSANSP
jgi:hypothetical protein